MTWSSLITRELPAQAVFCHPQRRGPADQTWHVRVHGRRKQGIFDIARGRTGWLVVFCVGLLVAAVVVSVSAASHCSSCSFADTP